MTAITTNDLMTARAKWLKRAGVVSFWFFFVKGLLWLAAPLVFYFVI